MPVPKRRPKMFKQKYPEKSVPIPYREFAEYPRELFEKLTEEEKAYLWRFTTNFEAGYFRKDGNNLINDHAEKLKIWEKCRRRRPDTYVEAMRACKLKRLTDHGSDGVPREDKLPSDQHRITTNLKGKFFVELLPSDVNSVEDDMIERLDLKRKWERKYGQT